MLLKGGADGTFLVRPGRAAQLKVMDQLSNCTMVANSAPQIRTAQQGYSMAPMMSVCSRQILGFR
jgi:hypothetical protein